MSIIKLLSTCSDVRARQGWYGWGSKVKGPHAVPPDGEHRVSSQLPRRAALRRSRWVVEIISSRTRQQIDTGVPVAKRSRHLNEKKTDSRFGGILTTIGPSLTAIVW